MSNPSQNRQKQDELEKIPEIQNLLQNEIESITRKMNLLQDILEHIKKMAESIAK